MHPTASNMRLAVRRMRRLGMKSTPKGCSTVSSMQHASCLGLCTVQHTTRMPRACAINPLPGNPTRSPSDARVAATAVLMRVRKAPFRRSPSEARALPLRLPAMQFCEPRSSPATCNMPHATVSMQLATCRTCHAAGNRVGNTERAVACKRTQRDLYPTRSVQQQHEARLLATLVYPPRSTPAQYRALLLSSAMGSQLSVTVDYIALFMCGTEQRIGSAVRRVGDQWLSCRGCMR